MNALIGSTGFVGSHLIREDMDVYTSKTIQSIRGKTYDTVYCAGVPAEKWKANNEPDADKATIAGLMVNLEQMKCRRFVLISTVDVYDASFPQDEEPDCCPNAYANHPYGVHRRELELWAQRTFPDVYIFRLPALFGHGLKKNALYDLLHQNRVEFLRSHWSFQWYWLGWLAADIEAHLARGHHLVNLVTPPVCLGLIQTLFFPETELSSEPTPSVVYNVGSRFGYAHTLEDVLREMTCFVRTKPTRKVVSELAWSPEQEARIIPYLRSRGIVGREIVPSKRGWNMSGYTNVYSAQSLLYGVSIQIFQEQERFLKILEERLSALASVGTKVIVFGSPAQRQYSGEDAISLFRRVGYLCEKAGILCCIENNAEHYGCNWLTTLEDTANFVDSVCHPSVAVSLDIGSMLLAGETEIPKKIRLGHVQVSFPHLGPVDPERLPEVLKILNQIPVSYTGMVSLEMREPVSIASLEWFCGVVLPSQLSP